MRKIYNEGRVVGLSQWELYVRQLLSLNPEATPMSESEWLASSISESSSMILRIPEGTTAGYHDYPMPEGCNLCGASVVYASVFQGNVIMEDNEYWAVKVDDYGDLISNTASRHPESPGEPEDVPVKDHPEVLTSRYMNYLKITEGLVIQPGEWIDNTFYVPLETEGQSPETVVTQDDEDLLAPVREPGPYSTLTPDFAKVGFVRILVKEEIDSDVFILLHGFADKALVAAGLNIMQAGRSRRPQDGDFLGPSMFPWSCPIVLTMTTDVASAVTSKMMDMIMLLASFHHVRYVTPLLESPDGQQLLTEDNHELMANLFGTVEEMWKNGGHIDTEDQAI